MTGAVVDSWAGRLRRFIERNSAVRAASQIGNGVDADGRRTASFVLTDSGGRRVRVTVQAHL